MATLFAIPSSEWGPILWKILHILAEHTNEYHIELWKSLLSSLPNLIMCDYCRLHVEYYIQKYPLINTPIRDYLYYFHEYVNKQADKSTFNYSLLTSTYKATEDLENLIQQFHDLVKRAVQLKILDASKSEYWFYTLQELTHIVQSPL